MASKASPAATDRQDCAGLRSRPACLPAVAYVNSIRLADPRCCPKDGDTKTLSLRGTKKQPLRLLFCASAGAKRQKGISGKAFPVPWGCPEDWGYEDAVPSRDKKSSLSGCYFCASEGTRTHTHKGTRS